MTNKDVEALCDINRRQGHAANLLLGGDVKFAALPFNCFSFCRSTKPAQAR